MPEADLQRENVARAAAVLARIAAEHELVVTHGNGPQVGLLSLQADAYRRVRPYPLDVLDAESEGMIGYWIEQELRSLLPGRQVATLLTQITVDPDDRAFSSPTKPIGPVYPPTEGRELAVRHGWTLAPEGDGVRRVVPSPEPGRILEIATIRLLVEAGVIVVCAGGGGIPVVETAAGAFRGAEAVIDKDLAAALLAGAIEADALLLLTDVDAVYLGWGRPEARALRSAAPEELRGFDFEPGSMAPKVEAACRFVESGGRLAVIGSLEDGDVLLEARTGTVVRRAHPTSDGITP